MLIPNYSQNHELVMESLSSVKRLKRGMQSSWRDVKRYPSRSWMFLGTMLIFNYSPFTQGPSYLPPSPPPSPQTPTHTFLFCSSPDHPWCWCRLEIHLVIHLFNVIFPMPLSWPLSCKISGLLENRLTKWHMTPQMFQPSNQLPCSYPLKTLHEPSQ
jgi:hypothetical protein